MIVPSTGDASSSLPAGESGLTVLVLADQPLESLETAADRGQLEIHRPASIARALEELDDVDCLVVSASHADEAPVEFVDRVRTRRCGLPIVFLTNSSEQTASLQRSVADTRWVDVLETEADDTLAERLRYRIPRLVDRHRLAALSNRSLAGVELARDAIAISSPGGCLEFANRSFAMQFGYERDALVATPWETLFDDDTVDRLEATAIPTVADGWRWTGTCTGRRRTGATFPARVRLDGLEDGSLVFVVDPLEPSADTPTSSDSTSA
ncbi:PAS domain-containing protein [Natrarchaeobaculum sulfurireducens]|uniref:HTR-like protein n=1 Tax=Natrarchaeobaculum sulfurireducens TaxID=2044521 RepID=A0A346PVC3_9EURY|nr:PAS domain-containing protein [Natrarchaeobaculum sulfurireducens]AXR83468.1 HTR-like protein [Natrarchaeobaculum sulfurireducens]